MLTSGTSISWSVLVAGLVSTVGSPAWNLGAGVGVGLAHCWVLRDQASVKRDCLDQGHLSREPPVRRIRRGGRRGVGDGAARNLRTTQWTRASL